MRSTLVRLLLAIAATVWLVIVLAVYVGLPHVLGWPGDGMAFWYGFGWIGALLVAALPVAVFAQD